MYLSPFVLMAERVKFCQHFGLNYAVRTSLQAYSAWKLVARLWGVVRRLAK